ncbi:hypothetical protein KAH55_08295, partial [bacterium]|nr:hypothetical protein [bacterium]
RLKLKTGDSIKNFHALINVTPFRYHDENMAILVMEDVSKLLELRQVLPICVKCKKIRNDSEYWDHLEKFFKEWLDLDFSHGLCPDCYEEELKKIKTFQPKIQLGIRLPSEKKE